MQKAHSKQKLRELIRKTKGYIKDGDTLWLLIIVHFKMTHYCASGENGSWLPGVKQAYFLSLDNRKLFLWRPGPQSGWAGGSGVCSPGQRASAPSEWKDTRGSVLEMAVKVQLWPWKNGTDKACVQTNLTGHNLVSERERHSGSVWTQPRGSVPWWDVGDIQL